MKRTAPAQGELGWPLDGSLREFAAVLPGSPDFLCSRCGELIRRVPDGGRRLSAARELRLCERCAAVQSLFSATML